MDNTIVENKMVLHSIEEMISDVIKDYCTDMVRRKKMYVTAGVHADANGYSVISVQEAFGEPFDVPFVPDLYNVQPGDSVWVEWAYGLGNACAVNSGSWKKTFITADENGITLTLTSLQVDGHIGGDVVNTQGTTSATVNGKIQDVIDSLAKYLTGDVTITVPDGTYVEDVQIEGFTGPGTLTILFDKEAVVKGDWTIRGNKRVIIAGDTDGTDTTQFEGVIEDAVMELRGNEYIKVSGVEIRGVQRDTGDTGQDYGVYVRDGSYAYIANCLIEQTQTAVYVEHAHLDIINCTGGAFSTDETTVANLTEGVVISADGGYVNAKGTIPAGPDSTGTGYEDNGYPFTCSGTVSPVVSGGTPPPPVTEVTSTWTASGGYYCQSYQTGTESYQGRATGWKGSTYSPRMGYYSSDQKYTAGLWIFSDAATIATTLAGATIKKATVSLTRSGSGGASSGTVIKPYYHNLTTATIGNFAGRNDPWNIGTSDDVYTDCLCDAQYIAPGSTGTFELPSSMYSKLQDGSVKGFAVGMDHDRPYFLFSPYGCTLTVTYEV